MAALERAWSLASSKRPGDVGAWLDVNERFQWLGWTPRAAQAARAVLDVEPEHPRALALLGATERVEGHRFAAARLAERALSAATTEPPYLALVERARALSTGDAAAVFFAVQTLQRAMELAPDRPEAPNLMGRLTAEASQFAAALPYLEHAARHEPAPDGGRHVTLRLYRDFANLLGGRPAHGRADDFSGTEVPLQRRPSLPAITGRLANGRGDSSVGWLVIDSGAAMPTLGPSAAPLLLRTQGSTVPALTATGSRRLQPAVLPVLEIGSLRLTDVPVLLDEGQREPIGPGVIGALGVSMLREFHVILDVQRRRFRLLPPLGPLRLPPVSVPEGMALVTGGTPFELTEGLMLVPARFDRGATRSFVFDTGADSLFVDPQVLVADLGVDLDDPALPRSITVGLGGHELISIVVPLSGPFHFGGIPFRGIVAMADEFAASRARSMRLDFSGTLGMLVEARFGLDFVTRRIVFDVVSPRLDR